MELISVDLPTSGMPQISTRMGLAIPPRVGASTWHAAISALVGACRGHRAQGAGLR